MAAKVLIPTPLRNLTNNQAEVTAEGATITALIDDLSKNYNGLRDRLVDENGKIRRFVNIYLNEEDIRFLQGEATAVKAGDQISIVPAIAGGK
jgi:molybdopterin synthase sulfur carrier subunit